MLHFSIQNRMLFNNYELALSILGNFSLKIENCCWGQAAQVVQKNVNYGSEKEDLAL